MLTPTAEERKALLSFFRDAAPKYHGLYDWQLKKLKDTAEAHGAYQKNLSLLRGIKDLDYKRLEGYCRICRKEGRQVEWINQVLPENNPDSLTSNLIVDLPIHRLLIKAVMPPAEFSYEKGYIYDGVPAIENLSYYSLGDLLEHFQESFHLPTTKENEKCLVGALKYILASHSVDVILFAIDFATGENITSPLDLLNKGFIEQGEAEIWRRGTQVCQ